MKARQCITPAKWARSLMLHEHQSKDLLGKYGVPVPHGAMVEDLSKIKTICKGMKTGSYIVKSQILAGGRGKGKFTFGGTLSDLGGVQLARSSDEAVNIGRKMLGNYLVTKQTGPAGVKVRRLLLEEALSIKREIYFALLTDRAAGGPIMIASLAGGVNIEEVAAKNPELIIKMPIDIHKGLSMGEALAFAVDLKFSGQYAHDCAKCLVNMWRIFKDCDATQIEINPLAELTDGTVICLDSKMNFDESAEFRHPDLFALKDDREENDLELQAKQFGLNYIHLDGNIGCLVNGAGLAMATMDTIKLFGGEPANFLDVGGGATKEDVMEAFKIIMADPQVKGIIVNIFGGIMKCDVIAAGIVGATSELNLDVPLVVRLAGTNEDLGAKILSDSGLNITVANDMDDAAEKMVALLPK